MTLYEIVTALQSASGSNAKQAILEQHKDNELLKAYLKAVYDPSISYYQTKVKFHEKNLGYNFNSDTIDAVVKTLAMRELTGDAAKAWLDTAMKGHNEGSQELISLIIKRSIGAGVGDAMILKVFPDLYFIPSYQRCSLMDSKAKEKFSKQKEFIIQQKLDGSFCYLIKEAGKDPQAITRSGSTYPLEFAQNLAHRLPDDFVVIGELLVLEEREDEPEYLTLDRQTGNGILNSILKGGNTDDKLCFELVAWDCVTVKEFKAGYSKTPYKERGTILESFWESIVEMNYVKSLEEAFAINSQYIAKGLEGSVIKTLDFEWRNGTSKDCIKLKIEFECDLKVIGMKEGTGKYQGMMGSLTVASSDGKVVSDVGTGFSDEARKAWWEMYTPDSIKSYEIVITVKANDIILSKSKETVSLFLPVYTEERLDKDEADSYERCVEQLESIKKVEK